MTTPPPVSRSSLWGFAVGVGACAIAIVAVPLTFLLGNVNHWLLFGLSFVGGALLGALLAPRALAPARTPPPSDAQGVSKG